MPNCAPGSPETHKKDYFQDCLRKDYDFQGLLLWVRTRGETCITTSPHASRGHGLVRILKRYLSLRLAWRHSDLF
ncbi:hypothetical protein CHS0354_022421 [Potamilus streckersoni]|uniref:Uncharacterized protein n=1 Tax=Potamilus streckersoni TaxID=2493646 RepID=A0AAE0W3L6_9BIVA|nr:hypothetical protein CHS0354_022421 [Potamilus streckersoni]